MNISVSYYWDGRRATVLSKERLSPNKIEPRLTPNLEIEIKIKVNFKRDIEVNEQNSFRSEFTSR